MSEPTAAQRLREDLAFAAPEMWSLHVERRIDEAVAVDRAKLAEQVRALQLDPKLGESARLWNVIVGAFLDLIERQP